MNFVLNKLKSRIFSDISQILPKLVHLKYMNTEFPETCVPLQQLHIINIKISQKKGFVGFKTLCPNFCYTNGITSERINYMLHVFIFTPLHHHMWQKNERDEQNKCRSYGTQWWNFRQEEKLKITKTNTDWIC